MENEIAFSNAIGLPDEIVPTLINSQVCEYASIKKDGTPITSPLIPFPGQDGLTIDINTGLAYSWKAERARNNPKVCLLYSEMEALAGERPPLILVYGQATVLDADLQANTDRYTRAIRSFSSLFGRLPLFILQGMVGYIARIWITVTPVRVLWWPDGDLEKPTHEWLAPDGIHAPPSDPKPKPLLKSHKPLTATPTDWREDMEYAFDLLGQPILTVVDEGGYPVPFRVRGSVLQDEGAHLDLHRAMPTKAQGRACLTFHSCQVKNGEMVANENLAFVGSVSGDWENAIFKVERQLPSVSFKLGLKEMLSLGLMMQSMKRRLDLEARRRGQSVPKVRL